MNTNKKQESAHNDFMKNEMKESVRNIGKILGITLAVYAGIRWLLPLAVPFFIAFLLAKILNPAIVRLEKKIRLKRSVWSSILVGILLIILSLLIFIFFKTLLEQVKNVVANFGTYKRQAGELWHECCCQLENITGIEAKTFKNGVEQQVPKVMQRMQEDMLPTIMTGTISYAKSIFVGLGIGFVVIVSTILILKDYTKIRMALENHPIGKMGLRVCRRTYEAGGAYIKSQIIIMFVITAICVVGLYLSGNEYALLAGCGIGICDAMPFLGTGTVFVPWAIFEMIQGKYMLASIYAVIYTICSLVREVLEPKLLGNKLGMHPLTVIASIYVGLGIYGLWGFVLGPFSYILIREIYLTI